MNLANMAAGRVPWIGAGPLMPGADLSLQLGFALEPPMEPPREPLGAPFGAWSWTSEPRDSARHGAELAAVLVSLQPVESGFLPLLDVIAPPPLEDLPAAPPMPDPEREGWLAPMPARLPPPEWLMF
ncbi:hypothetical protein KTR66_08645 [Roseococcus sp. SDR]|uniref:hypothetical protein n=1 Tax=Roseococcus sp. SDR TaxID=2835532 RepID=UPI001BCD8DB8|nr:hypothetical protein [Roseococcus sp. SDR]MBS7790061.1 hypothetical protein [Roseococcus sp. SDR]MBV1845375.1 hypothetical protein [Roseococcus sp. SDR]